MLKGMFGPDRQGATGYWRKLGHVGRGGLCCNLSICGLSNGICSGRHNCMAWEGRLTGTSSRPKNLKRIDKRAGVISNGISVRVWTGAS